MSHFFLQGKSILFGGESLDLMGKAGGKAVNMKRVDRTGFCGFAKQGIEDDRVIFHITKRVTGAWL